MRLLLARPDRRRRPVRIAGVDVRHCRRPATAPATTAPRARRRAVGYGRRAAARRADLAARRHHRRQRARGRASPSCTPSSSARGPRLPPHYWLSDEWFTPDGVAGIAIPSTWRTRGSSGSRSAQMLEVEGGEPEWCMRILRHEAGHAIDNAYKLRRRPQRREAVRPPRRSRIPSSTRRKPVQQELRPAPRCLVRAEPSRRGLRRDVRRLADAELASGASATPAGRRCKKLEYMDALMQSLAGQPPRASTTPTSSTPLPQLRKTLRQHYARQAPALRRRSPELLRSRPAAPVLRRAGVRQQHRPPRSSSARIRTDGAAASSPTGPAMYQYTIDQVLEDMIARCRELKLRLAVPEDQARQEFTVLLTVQTMNYLHSGGHRVCAMKKAARPGADARPPRPARRHDRHRRRSTAEWKMEYDVIETLRAMRARGARRSASATTSASSGRAIEELEAAHRLQPARGVRRRQRRSTRTSSAISSCCGCRTPAATRAA